MRPTVEYIEQCIRSINQQCFSGELPMLPVVLSSAGRRLGALSYTRSRPLFGKQKNSNFKMIISTRYDFDEDVIRDTICHEMIHYYIAWKGIKDTSVHGAVFKTLMNDLNSRYGYHMTVTHRLTDEELMSAPKTKTFLLCISSFEDGRTGLTISARTRLFELWKELPKLPGVTSTKWYASRDSYFGKYRSSRRPAAYFVDKEEVEAHLADAHPLIKDGDTIYWGKRP